jgi:hypothetical protein
MKSNKRKSGMHLFVLKKKTNNKGLLNPIIYCSYTLALVHISTKKDLEFLIRKRKRKFHGRRSSSHPIRSPAPNLYKSTLFLQRKKSLTTSKHLTDLFSFMQLFYSLKTLLVTLSERIEKYF